MERARESVRANERKRELKEMGRERERETRLHGTKCKILNKTQLPAITRIYQFDWKSDLLANEFTDAKETSKSVGNKNHTSQTNEQMILFLRNITCI